MKKRNQLPDSYTYSTLFNGLAINGKTASVGRRAVALWNSLNNPNSKIKPSVLLTNAALRACAAANDMDAVWAIAGAIPDEGADAANSITYTTILNAMRFSTEINPMDQRAPTTPTEEQQAAMDTIVAQGRQIWTDIISRWTSARLTVDEDLVCAMGRLLHAGVRPQDWDDIFSLCKQTMDIPRPAAGLLKRDSRFNPQIIHQLPPPFGRSDRTVVAEPDDLEMIGKEFSVPAGKRGIWVKPTNQTLTLLIETCQKMFLRQAGEQVWKQLTDPKGLAIKPDSVSLHAYLRLLRQSKASAETVRFVRDAMKDERPQAKTFFIAMSACLKNQFSPNAMREATELMDIMASRMHAVDIRTAAKYMNLAIQSPHAQDTLVALAYMTPRQTKLWEILKNGSEKDKEMLLELGKLVVSGFDRVIYVKTQKKEEGKHSVEEYKERKAVWTYVVQRLVNGGERVRNPMSDEELTLLARKKALARFARKKDRERMRDRRRAGLVAKVEPVGLAKGKGTSSPNKLAVLESDIH